MRKSFACLIGLHEWLANPVGQTWVVCQWCGTIKTRVSTDPPGDDE